jgi:hypothetical protein
MGFYTRTFGPCTLPFSGHPPAQAFLAFPSSAASSCHPLQHCPQPMRLCRPIYPSHWSHAPLFSSLLSLIIRHSIAYSLLLSSCPLSPAQQETWEHSYLARNCYVRVYICNMLLSQRSASSVDSPSNYNAIYV